METNVTTIGIIDSNEFVFVETNSFAFVLYLEKLGHTEKVMRDFGEMGIAYYFKIDKKYLGDIFYARANEVPSESGPSEDAGGDFGESQEGGDSLL